MSKRSDTHQGEVCTFTLDGDELAAVAAVAKVRRVPVETVIGDIVRDYASPTRVAVAMLTTLSPARRTAIADASAATVAKRLAIVQEWSRWRDRVGKSTKATGDFLSQVVTRHGVKLSRGTLYNWQKRHTGGGARALADRRQTPRPRPDRSAAVAPFVGEFQRVTLATRGPVNLSACYRAACVTARRKRWPIPSLKTVKRHVKRAMMEVPRGARTAP
jgi:hypothetical protein